MASKDLQQSIDRKIDQIKAIENDIPAVIIIHDIRDSTVVYMSPRGLRELNVSLDQLKKMGTDYHNKFFNPQEAKEYVPKILGLIERNNDEESVSHFQQVRFSTHADWTWHLSATKILMRDESGRPLLTISTAIAVDPKHNFTAKVERLVEDNNFLRRYSEVFASLTRREKDVLKLMALGCSSKEVAVQLKMSQATAATHRRNIKQKLQVHNNYDIIRFAQAFDLI